MWRGSFLSILFTEGSYNTLPWIFIYPFRVCNFFGNQLE